MGYASISRGFKSGGFDQRRVAEGTSGEFDEETATNYELGWKTSWGGRRLPSQGGHRLPFWGGQRVLLRG